MHTFGNLNFLPGSFKMKIKVAGRGQASKGHWNSDCGSAVWPEKSRARRNIAHEPECR